MSKPIDTVNALTDALNRGDLEAAAALYEAGAILVAQPGRVARGTNELRAALAGFLALRPVLRSEAQQVIEAGDVALYTGRWSLQGKDQTGQPVSMGGESSDILRRQPDGRWLVAIDNPWGAAILPRR